MRRRAFLRLFLVTWEDDEARERRGEGAKERGSEGARERGREGVRGRGGEGARERGGEVEMERSDGENPKRAQRKPCLLQASLQTLYISANYTHKGINFSGNYTGNRGLISLFFCSRASFRQTRQGKRLHQFYRLIVFVFLLHNQLLNSHFSIIPLFFQ